MSESAMLEVSAISHRRDFTVLLLIAGVAALVIVLYSETFWPMAAMWRQSSHNHGTLVLPISAYLLWRSRESLARIELSPWPWGIGLLVVLVAVWILARAVGVQVAEQTAAVLLIPASVLTFLGTGVARRALFPLLFLLAAVPLGDALIPYLMRVTADVSSALLRTFGVPVFREGQFMSLPGGEFEVADVCGGLRYLTSGVLLSLLFSYLTYRRLYKRAIFVLATSVSLILANGVRAFVVMLVASATDMRVFAGRDHVYFGWVLFAIVAVLLFWIGAHFADPADESTDRVPAAGHSDSRRQILPLIIVLGLVLMATTARPFRDDLGSMWLILLPAGALLIWAIYRATGDKRNIPDAGSGPAVSAFRRPGAIASACAAVAVLAAGSMLLPGQQAKSPDADAAHASAGTYVLPKLAGCSAAGPWTEDWAPRLDAPDYAAAGSFTCAGAPVNVYLAGYDRNVQGRELISEANALFPQVWRRFVTHGQYRFATDGGDIEVNEVLVDGGGRRSVIWYWYAVGHHTVTSPTLTKLLQAWELVRSGRSDGRVYLLETALDGSPDAARERLASIARRLAPAAMDVADR